MNKHEQRAQAQRNASLRSSMGVWNAGIALVVVVLIILGLSASAPSDFFFKGAIGVAILLLIVRQVTRRLRSGGTPRAARPDPKSSLKLD